MAGITGVPGEPHAPDTDSVISECRRSVRWTWIALVVVIVLYLVLASLVAVKTPAWESPDEPAHVLNIETLVSGHWYAIDTHCHYPATKRCDNLEAQQAPLYYLLLAAWQKTAGVSIDNPRPGPVNPRALVALHLGRSPAGIGGLYLHHSAADDRFILWLRFPNVMLGALTILITFFAVRQFARDKWTPVIAAAVAASIPHFVFLSAVVTNDNLVTLLGAALTLFAIRALVRMSVWPVVGVGLVFGLLLATKLTALPMGLVVVGLPLILTRNWVLRTEFFLAELAAVACAAGWYLVQNTVRYGDPLALTASTKYLQANGGLALSSARHIVLPILFITFLCLCQRA